MKRRLFYLIPATLMLSACQSGETKTAAWLQTQGFSQTDATSMASNKPALRQYILREQYSRQDDTYCRSLGATPGSDAYVQCRVSVANNRASNVEQNLAARHVARSRQVTATAPTDTYRPPEIAPWPGRAQ